MSTIAEPQTMTMFEWHAQMVENTANTLAYWIEKTREDKVGWAPAMEGSVNTRCALELGAECAMVNRGMAALFKGEDANRELPTYSSPAECCADVRESGKVLADAVRSLDESALTREYNTQFGPMPGGALMQISLGNMYYHGGQVNMIQLLYGDPQFYVPGRD